MRRYLLDTGPLAAFFLNRPRAIHLMSPWVRRSEAATSILVYGEIIEYLQGHPGFAVRRAQLRRVLQEITPYLLTYSVLDRYAQLRRQIRTLPGGLIGDVDTLIAATALERDLTVVTMDRDFERVPGLKVEVLPRHS